MLLVPKCGMIKMHHWAHRANSYCHMYEPMSEWHVNWQMQIKNPVGGVNVEVPVVVGTKYKRADIKTRGGCVGMERLQ